jgi:hypothetical protein
MNVLHIGRESKQRSPFLVPVYPGERLTTQILAQALYQQARKRAIKKPFWFRFIRVRV